MDDIKRIISELERQRTAIDRAIAALREVSVSGAASQSIASASPGGRGTKKRALSPEGRQRIIDATKRRWANKRAAEAQKGGAASGRKSTGKRASGARKKQAAKKAEA